MTSPHHLFGAVALFVLSTFNYSCAETLDLPPPYQPSISVSGAIRIWGHGSYGQATDFVEGLTRAWEEGFRKHHPGIRFENDLRGTASAIGALYTGTGDLALMGREIWDPEVAAFKEVFGYGPTGVDVMTGSFDVRNKGYALVVFTHKDNPVNQLTLAQLDAAYGVARRRGGHPVTTWGDLGATGSWANKPVHLYGLPIARGFAEYFQDTVFLGSALWNPSLHEFADRPGTKGGAGDGGQMMLNAMASDPLALGYAGLVYRHPDVKPVALAREAKGPFVMPTRETVMNKSYPLTRVITVFFKRAPGTPADAKVTEFLRYILSREGQQAVSDHGGGYLPLLAPTVANELKKLEGH
jgi:phosphate transport system substrate-binding protein